MPTGKLNLSQLYLKKDFLNKCLIFLVCITYATILASLPVREFADRVNYLTYADSSGLIFLSRLSEGIINVFANEPIWLAINFVLSLFFEPANVVRILIFFPSLIFSYIFLKTDPKNLVWLILFLFIPQLLKNYVIHLRQGVAIAFFMSGFVSKSQFKKWLLIGISPFIHASFFFVIPLVYFSNFFKNSKIDNDLRLFLVGACFVVVSISIPVLTDILGARQAGRYSIGLAENTTGLGFIFWLCVLLVTFFEGKKFLSVYSFAIYTILIYVVTYFLTEVTARIFESGLPIVLISLLQLKAWRKKMFLLMIILFFVIQWLMMISAGSFKF